MMQVELQETNEQFMKLLDLVANGEEVILFKNKRPFAKLLPIVPAKRQRQFGSAKGLIQMADDFDEPLTDFEEYM